MNHVEYNVMYHSEENHWWYMGLRDLVLALIHRLGRDKKSIAILDAGCGTGKLLEVHGRERAFGLELSHDALPFLRQRGLPNLAQGTICRMPYPDETFDLVVSMDVICCVGSPGDIAALREIARVLRPDGRLILNLPAYETLRSHHDAAVHTRQRYTRGQLRALLSRVGLEVEVLTYRNSILFPLAAMVRYAQRVLEPAPVHPKSDLKQLPKVLNRLLVLPLWLENRLIRAGIRLPFGLSVFCVARKPDQGRLACEAARRHAESNSLSYCI